MKTIFEMITHEGWALLSKELKDLQYGDKKSRWYFFLIKLFLQQNKFALNIAANYIRATEYKGYHWQEKTFEVLLAMFTQVKIDFSVLYQPRVVVVGVLDEFNTETLQKLATQAETDNISFEIVAKKNIVEADLTPSTAVVIACDSNNPYLEEQIKNAVDLCKAKGLICLPYAKSVDFPTKWFCGIQHTTNIQEVLQVLLTVLFGK